MAFEFKRKIITPNAKPAAAVAEVYVGIDFGTTFTKVSFQIGDREGTTKYSLRFGSAGTEEDYCLPSVLGYHKPSDSLAFTSDPKAAGIEEIRYFKYSMIEKGVPRSVNLEGRQLHNDPQRICSAFYIAHVLKMAKACVRKHGELTSNASEIRWYVNMGVPVSDFNAKPKPVYDEALNVAWNLSEREDLPDIMGLRELDGLYDNWVDHRTWSARLNTVPELYAELIMFLQDRTVDTGFYSVIDIGGGTVDMAVFFKRIDQYSHRVEISCVAQDVCPLGYEMFRHVLDGQMAQKRMQSSYGGLVNEAYHHHRAAMQKARNSGNKLVHFYMGGARGVDFYHDCVGEMVELHRQCWACYPGAADGDMVAYMRGKAYLAVDDNPRLLISQMLAQPFEKMPELSGQPWHFDRVSPQRNAPSAADLQLAIYGD